MSILRVLQGVRVVRAHLVRFRTRRAVRADRRSGRQRLRRRARGIEAFHLQQRKGTAVSNVKYESDPTKRVNIGSTVSLNPW